MCYVLLVDQTVDKLPIKLLARSMTTSSCKVLVLYQLLQNSHQPIPIWSSRCTHGLIQDGLYHCVNVILAGMNCYDYPWERVQLICNLHLQQHQQKQHHMQAKLGKEKHHPLYSSDAFLLFHSLAYATCLHLFSSI